MNIIKAFSINLTKFIFWIFILTGVLLLSISYWITTNFGTITIDQILMNIAGADIADEELKRSFFFQALAIPIAGVTLSYILYLTTKNAIREVSKSKNSPERKNILNHGITHMAIFGILSSTVLLLGVNNISKTISVEQYVKASQTELNMDKFYKDPSENKDLSPSPSEPKNLILIFTESIENGFSDTEAFGEDLLRGVKQATDNWDSIESLEMYNGGGWTMSGLISTMCGIPNRSPGITPENLNAIGDDIDTFMPNATCLGDVLKQSGYENIFLGGADRAFANKGTFLQTHGYDQILDLNVWEERGETELNSWGLGDKQLFENAKQELAKLRSENKPYNMTMLTVDSHEPAHLLAGCETNFAEQKPLAAATRCSMDHLGEFIDYLEETGVLEDTVVIITGDHLKTTAEGGVFTEELGNKPNRTIFNRIYHPDYRIYNQSGEYRIDTGIERQNADQLDWYGTILELLQKGRTDGRAGVGTSVYQPSANPSQTALGGALGLTPTEYEELITSHSRPLYRWLWGSEEQSPERVDSSENVDS